MALTHMAKPRRREKEPGPATVSSGGDRDKYDYEHRIQLDHEALKKLKVPEGHTKGRVVLHAHGYISAHHTDETQEGGKKRRMTVQLTHMEMKPHPSEGETAKAEKLDEVAGSRKFGAGGE